MKGILDTILISAVSLLLFSCEYKESFEVPVGGEIILDLSSGITKATVEDTQAEAFVNHLDVFIFSDNAGTPSSVEYYGRYTVNNASHITLGAKKSSFDENAPYHIFLIANSNISEADFRSILDTDGYDGLIGKKQEDALLHLTGLDVKDAPKYFLMDAALHDIDLNNGNSADNTEIAATLSRAAAKVVVNIAAGEKVEFKSFTIEQGSEGARYYIRNLPYNAFLFAEAKSDEDVKAAVRNTAKEGDKHFSWDPSADNKNVSLLTYVYPNSWSEGSLLENETCVIMNLPMIFTPGVGEEPVEYHNSWYKIHMTGEKVLRRNNYYEVNINLNRPGAISEVNPVEIEDMQYIVEEWTGQSINVGGDDKPKYLMVNRDMMEMHNVSTDGTTLEFASSSPVTIDVENAYYYDKFGQKKSVPSAIVISGTTDGGIAGNIKVNSPVPTNNAIRYFTLVVTNQDGLVERVNVTQYPLEYITNILATYSYRDDFYYPAGHIDDEDNLSVPTTWNVTGDRITSASWSSGAWNYLQGNSSGAFRSKIAAEVYTTGTNAGLADIDYYYYTKGRNGNIVKSTSNSLDPGNPRMYHVQIKATSSTYTLGIPVLDSDGFTDSSADNAKLVSPSFMLASQLGAVNSGSFDNYDMVASHCREYVEVYIDPVTNEEVHLRDWRLPTRAEVEIIYKFQNDSEVMDEVLAGRYYWCADKSTVENKKYSSSGTGLRCIRDVY